MTKEEKRLKELVEIKNTHNLSFWDAKELYKMFRQDQKYEIIDRLSDLGIEVITERDEKSGQGKSFYGYKRFKKYDNTNWKWVDIIIDNKVAFCISLQAFDRDPTSGNYHVLFDRIGVYKYHDSVFENYWNSGKDSKERDSNKLKTINAVQEMKNSSIDLPMDEDKFKELIGFLYQCVSENMQCLKSYEDVSVTLKNILNTLD